MSRTPTEFCTGLAYSTAEPVERLLTVVSAEARRRLAARLGKAFSRGDGTGAQRLLAIEIFKLLACDMEVNVRQALAEHLKCSPLLPRTIARRLAADVESVALPLLSVSPVFTDDDLIAVILSGNTAKQCTIAQRSTVSEPVSEVLVNTGKKEVVGTLLANSGAVVSTTSYHGALERFEQDRDIHSLLVERVTLPFPVKVRLIALVSEDLQRRLVVRHGIPLSLIAPVTVQGQERALLDCLSATTAMADIEEAATLLLARGVLTPSLLLRALCVGRLDLFTAFVAALADMPIAAVEAALKCPDSAAFRSLYGRTQLPAHLQRAFRIALDVVLEVEFYSAAGWQSGDEELTIHGLVREYRQFSPDSLEGILGQIGRLPPDL